jgi:hypothetical protein
MMTMQTFLAGDVQKLVEKAQSLESGKQDHFLFLMSALLECYLKEEARATVITFNDIEEKTCIIPINATQEEVEGMIDFMADAFKAGFQPMNSGSLN